MDVYLTIDAERSTMSTGALSKYYTEPLVSRLPISAFHSFQRAKEADEVRTTESSIVVGSTGRSSVI